MTKVYHLEEQKSLPPVAEAVGRVAAYLRQQFPQAMVLDVSARRLPWDLEVWTDGRRRRVEVKLDFQAEATGNLVWENISVARGAQAWKAGWGRQPGMDYLVYILYPSWRAYFLDAPALRSYVLAHWEHLRDFRALNPTYEASGKLVPLDALVARAIVRHVARLEADYAAVR